MRTTHIILLSALIASTVFAWMYFTAQPTYVTEPVKVRYALRSPQNTVYWYGHHLY